MKALKYIWFCVLVVFVYLGMVLVMSAITDNPLVIIIAPMFATPIFLIPLYL